MSKPQPEPSDDQRSRTITWADPNVSAEAVAGMSGLDFLTAMMTGEVPLPPMAETLDFRLTEVSDGFAVFVCTPAEFHYNPVATVHGGLAATLLDSATACAVHSTLAAGHGYTTTNLSVDFLRPMTADTGPIRCEGRVVHRGRRLAIAEGKLLRQADGKVLARGQSSCMIFAP